MMVKLRNIQQALEKYYGTEKAYPESLKDLVSKNLLSEEAIYDIWEYPVFYRLDGGNYLLRCVGRDGKYGTEDDLPPPVGMLIHYIPNRKIIVPDMEKVHNVKISDKIGWLMIFLFPIILIADIVVSVLFYKNSKKVKNSLSWFILSWVLSICLLIIVYGIWLGKISRLW